MPKHKKASKYLYPDANTVYADGSYTIDLTNVESFVALYLAQLCCSRHRDGWKASQWLFHRSLYDNRRRPYPCGHASEAVPGEGYGANRFQQEEGGPRLYAHLELAPDAWLHRRLRTGRL